MQLAVVTVLLLNRLEQHAPVAFDHIVSFLNWFDLARIYPILAHVRREQNLRLPLPSPSSFYRCLWSNSRTIKAYLRRKTILDCEPIRSRLASDPHLLMHLHSDFIRNNISHCIPEDCDTLFSVNFLTDQLAPTLVRAETGTNLGDVKRILFNPRRPIIAVVKADYGSFTLGIYAMAGTERSETGGLLHFYAGPRTSDCFANTQLCDMHISWSPEGDKLLCLQPDSATDSASRVTLFFVAESGLTRRIHSPNMPKMSHPGQRGFLQGSAECWSSNDTFWILTGVENLHLTKITIQGSTLIVESAGANPIIPGGLKVTSLGVWTNDSTAFWVQPCRVRGHYGHSLVRRQSLQSPRCFPDGKALALSAAYVVCAELSVGNTDQLLLIMACPEGINFQHEVGIDADFVTVHQLDEDQHDFSSEGYDYKHGAGCNLPLPWLSASHKKYKLCLATVDCFEDDIDIICTVHNLKWATNFYSNLNATTNFEGYFQLVGQTERYAVIHMVGARKIVMMSKLGNFYMDSDNIRSKFAPNVDGSLIIPHLEWCNYGARNCTKMFTHSLPLKAVIPFDAKPETKSALSKLIRASGFEVGSIERTTCSPAEKMCRVCREVRERVRLEEYNRPLVFSIRYNFGSESLQLSAI